MSTYSERVKALPVVLPADEDWVAARSEIDAYDAGRAAMRRSALAIAADADAQVQALQAQVDALRKELAAREGWKLVPIEPTEQMLAAFSEAVATWVQELGDDADVYHALLAAAPVAQAPAAPSGEAA